MCFVYPVPTAPWTALAGRCCGKGLEDYERLWLARKGGDEISSAERNPDLGRRDAKLAPCGSIGTAQQLDGAAIPPNPTPAHMEGGRRMVNQGWIELAALPQQTN
jgi:hypothetical protein